MTVNRKTYVAALSAVALLTATIATSLATPAAAAGDFATVAIEGGLAPGTGLTFTGVDLSVLNGAGEAAFSADLSDGNEGIWVGPPGGLDLVALTGTPAPGAGGLTFTNLFGPLVNGAGEVAFLAELSDTSRGIWVGTAGNLELIARVGEPAPGAGSGVTFTSLRNSALNGAGQVAIVADLSDGGDGIWVGSRDSLDLVARTGDLAPGLSTGATFTDFSGSGEVLLNGPGQVVLRGGLSDGGNGIWVGAPGGLELVARDGDPAPGVAGGVSFIDFDDDVGLNGAGQVLLRAELSDGGEGLWSGNPDSIDLLARDGEILAGTAVTFVSFNGFVLNGAGEAAFLANLSDAGRVLLVGRPGDLAPVARNGDPAPGAANGVTFGNPFSPNLNGAGEVSFPSRTSAGDVGYWRGLPGGLELIALPGDTVEVAPGDVRTVLSLDMLDISGNEDGVHTGFNEAAQTVISMFFTDTTEGAFLSQPEAPQVHLMSHRTVDSNWLTVFPPQDFTNPVVIAGPPSFENRGPGVLRLREVGSRSFQVRFQEWRFQNGLHPDETVDFIVMEEGRQTLPDGSIWEAGTVKIRGNGRFKRKAFTRRFPGKPKVFLTVQSFRDSTTVTVRARNVSRSGFEAALFEEENLFGGKHKREIVGYIAIFSPGKSGTIAEGVGGTDYELRRPRVNHRFKTVLGHQIKLEEERSKDRERRHARERVAVMRLGRGFFAQQDTNQEIDTTAIRRRPPP